MARRTPTSQPQRAELTQQEMKRAIQRFKKVIENLEQFEPNSINDRDDPTITSLETAIRTAVEKTYPPGTTQYNAYISASSIDTAGISMMGPMPINNVREGLERGKRDAIALLNSAIEDLEEDLESQSDVAAAAANAADAGPREAVRDETNVFVVHGHDEGARETVARFIEKAGLHTIILHEQASQGKTVIEKLEKYSDVGFAVVLLTPDDMGGTQDGEMQPRARQNVVAELFYFIGKLGRDRVCPLKKGDLEEPSDIGGVVYIGLDTAGAWKMELLRELKAAGYTVDWEKALG